MAISSSTSSSTSMSKTSGWTRMADALLRTVGGQTVLLRMPVAAIPGDPGEQLGLAAPGFNDVELGPAVLRKVRGRAGASENLQAVGYELLLSAAAVEAVVGSLGFDAAGVLFGTAAGIVRDGEVLRILGVVPVEAFGVVSVYRVLLRGSLARAA